MPVVLTPQSTDGLLPPTAHPGGPAEDVEDEEERSCPSQGNFPLELQDCRVLGVARHLTEGLVEEWLGLVLVVVLPTDAEDYPGDGSLHHQSQGHQVDVLVRGDKEPVLLSLVTVSPDLWYEGFDWQPDQAVGSGQVGDRLFVRQAGAPLTPG